ncbi:hypothetical protein EDD16DRAFT_1126838 [Pisolithus croceorrhizus]|nr:hypothetical protein EDD16DRAFT_1126838 [Pisolithus croceorrhizus]
MSSGTMETRTPVSTSAIMHDDSVILIIEGTGSGTNNFIDKLTKVEEGAERFSSNTENVCQYACYHAGQRFVFVVTPRLLQDTMFKAIAKWLKDEYCKSILFTGVIYTHSTTNSGRPPADARSVELLGHLCGNNAVDRVRLVTTTCDQAEELYVDQVKRVPGTADQHSFTKAGARPERFDNTPEGAWKIVEGLENTKKTLLLQEELRERRMQLKSTSGQRDRVLLAGSNGSLGPRVGSL